METKKSRFILKGYIDFFVAKGEISGIEVAENTSCKIHVVSESMNNPTPITMTGAKIGDTTIPGAEFTINAKSKYDVPVFNADGTHGIAENGAEAYIIVTPYEYGGKKGIAKGVAFNLTGIKLTGKKIEIAHGVQIDDFGADF